MSVRFIYIYIYIRDTYIYIYIYSMDDSWKYTHIRESGFMADR